MASTGGDIQFSEQEILNKVFNESTSSLSMSAFTSVNSTTKYSVQEVLNKCFNNVTNELRVS